MTTLEAARDLRDQFKAQGQPAPWAECMRLAAECRALAGDAVSQAQAAYFRAFRAQKESQAWLMKVRSAAVITPARHKAKVAMSGSNPNPLAVTYCPPDPVDQFAA